MARRIGRHTDAQADAVVDFLEHVGGCERESELRALIAGVLERMALGTFHYARALEPGVTAGFAAEITNVSRAWLKHYVESDFRRSDIWTDAAMTSGAPTIWSEVTARHRLNAKQRQMQADGTEAGLVEGVSIPIRGSAGSAVLFVSSLASGPEGAAAVRRGAHALDLIGHLLYARSVEDADSRVAALPGQDGTHLSPRQREVLQWVALGKTDWEVATILTLSEQAVKFHIAGARRKLGAANRTHAVAKALSFGLIEPV